MKPEPPDRPAKKQQEEFFFEYLLKLVEQGKLSRRQFLRLTSYLAAIGVLSSISKRAKAAESFINLNPVDPSTVPQCQMDFEREILRSEDLLNLHFKFYNLNLALNGPLGPRLERVRPGETAYIVVEFPAQNIAEEAFLETAPYINKDDKLDPYGSDPKENDSLLPPGDVDARLAGPSRLAFKVPDDVQYIPYTLENLLSWADYEQNVVPVALPPQPPIIILSQKQPLSLQGGPTPPPTEPPINPPRPPVTPPEIREPLPCETAIEAPWRLFISTNKFAGWAHSVNPVTHKKRTELWHTRLGTRRYDADLGAYYVDEKESFYRTIRAIWTSGFNIPDLFFFWFFWQEPFRMSLTEKDRRKIVRLTSDFKIPDYHPKPVDVDRLMLTSLGAWIKFDGSWEPPIAESSLDIEKWVHRGTMGRDHYVRVVYKGFLFPFGNRASLIKVTERKFQEPPGGGNIFGPKPTAAYLRQRFYIIVRQPEISYPVVGQPYDGRESPFKKIRLTTLVTPNLDDPNDSKNSFTDAQQSFWPRVGGNDFLFHVIATDWEGKKSEFTIPLAFVSPDVATGQATTAVNTYNDYVTDPTLSRRKRSMSGQKITYAPSNKPGDTSLETNYLVFRAVENQNAAPGLPHFYPTIETAGIRLAAAEQISGGDLSGVEVSYHQRYIEHEFNKDDNAPNDTKNMGEVFVKVNTPAALQFAKADRAGGVITPNFSIYGISRSLGPIGKNQANGDDLGGWLASQFDPAQYFGDAAKLLGGVLLGKVMKATSIKENSENQDEIFKIVNRDIYDNSGLPVAIETKLLYKRVSLSPSNTAMQADPLKIFEPQADNSLEIKATFRTELSSPNESTFEIIGDIQKFNINLVEGLDDSLKFITIKFNKLTFISKKGQKPEIHPDIETVKLGGPLELVNELQKYLKMGSGIEVNADGITALYTLPIPGVAVGIFSLQNLSFSAGVNLPFTGEPARARFAFCERENPFLLTVAMFGGGGFFGIALGLDGLELLEAAFEFGGSLPLDIGVASGGVHVLAGAYFKLELNDNHKEVAHFEGYLRMGGELEILGIVSLSVEFYMSLSYDSPPKDEVWGQATLVVEIEVLVFSASVEMSVERRFAGSTHAITFEELVPVKADWEEYADAFAPLPV